MPFESVGGGGADGSPSVIGVGAIRRLFSLPCSSDSEPLLVTLSLLTPVVDDGKVEAEPLS